jgi:hypothetical protein
MSSVLPENIENFIRQVVPSFISWDILICFYKHPKNTGTISEIAYMIGRSEKDIKEPLILLVRLTIISARKINEEIGFELNKNSNLYPAFVEFSEYNVSQENRLKILSWLLEQNRH